jgi:hypothetical protein
MTVGGLADYHNDIPFTIKDAMTLCERLNYIEYLWVDAFCIPQDSQGDHAAEGERQFDAMGSIYSSACLTIVASSGSHSWAGLPGIRAGPRRPQQTEHFGGLSMALVKPNLDAAMKNSPWKERGWTFQEGQCPRLLIFTNHQVFFQCDTALWCEDTHHELPPQSVVNIRDVDIPPMDEPFWRDCSPNLPSSFRKYADAVKCYTSRNLTRESDVRKAFDFTNTQYVPLFHCLPRRYFGQALSFEPWSGTRRLPETEFPSWCWCGWKVPDGVLYNHTGFFLTTTFCCIKTRPGSAEIQLVPIEAEETDFGSYNRPSPSSLETTEVLSRLEKTELDCLVVFDAMTAKLHVNPESGGFRDGCPLKIRGLDGTGDSAAKKEICDACLIPACGKIRGDLVECVQIGLGEEDSDGNEMVCLLLVETDDRGVSRRIGTCDVEIEDWCAIPTSPKTVYLL